MRLFYDKEPGAAHDRRMAESAESEMEDKGLGSK